MKNPGIIYRLPKPDDRLVLVYKRQPLLKVKKLVVYHLVDENHNLIYVEGKPNIPRTLLRNDFDSQLEMIMLG